RCSAPHLDAARSMFQVASRIALPIRGRDDPAAQSARNAGCESVSPLGDRGVRAGASEKHPQKLSMRDVRAFEQAARHPLTWQPRLPIVRAMYGLNQICGICREIIR